LELNEIEDLNSELSELTVETTPLANTPTKFKKPMAPGRGPPRLIGRTSKRS
jgi:hypothetical protein